MIFSNLTLCLVSKRMNYPAAELRGIKMNSYLINPDAEHRGILLIKILNIGIIKHVMRQSNVYWEQENQLSPTIRQIERPI